MVLLAPEKQESVRRFNAAFPREPFVGSHWTKAGPKARDAIEKSQAVMQTCARRESHCSLSNWAAANRRVWLSRGQLAVPKNGSKFFEIPAECCTVFYFGQNAPMLSPDCRGVIAGNRTSSFFCGSRLACTRCTSTSIRPQHSRRFPTFVKIKSSRQIVRLARLLMRF